MSRPTALDGQVLLATVAIEPNRWGTIRPDRSPSTRAAAWLDELAALDVDGLELWDGHLPPDGDPDLAALRDGPTPVRILSSYVAFDGEDDAGRRAAAEARRRCGARAVKFNVGDDPSAADDYARRVGRWIDHLDGAPAICECHRGTIAEDPAVAARVLGAAGPPERVQALVHTHDGPEHLAAAFDALGERITHVHVNHLDPATLAHPTLAEVEDELGRTVGLLRAQGFAGSWTLEFVAGLLTPDDHPAALLAQAASDLVVLHRALGAA